MLLLAVQPHPALAVTVTLPLAPIDPPSVEGVGEMRYAHDVPACVTANV